MISKDAYSFPDITSEEDFAEHVIRLCEDTNLYLWMSTWELIIEQSIMLAEHYNYDENIFLIYFRKIIINFSAHEASCFICELKKLLPENIIYSLQNLKLKLDLLY